MSGMRKSDAAGKDPVAPKDNSKGSSVSGMPKSDAAGKGPTEPKMPGLSKKNSARSPGSSTKKSKNSPGSPGANPMKGMESVKFPKLHKRKKSTSSPKSDAKKGKKPKMEKTWPDGPALAPKQGKDVTPLNDEAGGVIKGISKHVSKHAVVHDANDVIKKINRHVKKHGNSFDKSPQAHDIKMQAETEYKSNAKNGAAKHDRAMQRDMDKHGKTTDAPGSNSAPASTKKKDPQGRNPDSDGIPNHYVPVANADKAGKRSGSKALKQPKKYPGQGEKSENSPEANVKKGSPAKNSPEANVTKGSPKSYSLKTGGPKGESSP